jgi:hypothetical protein
VVAAAAAYHADRSGKRKGRDAERDQENEIKAQDRLMNDEKGKADATLASRAERARQKALAASSGGYASTINTSPLGLSSNPTGKDKLGI